MYIYKVTELSTRKYYIGKSLESKDTYSETNNIDPHSVFKTKVSNGVTKISNVSKEILSLAADKKELDRLGIEFSTSFAKDPNFLGLTDSKNETKIEKVIVADSPSITEIKIDTNITDSGKIRTKNTAK